jgi:transposase-like protein
MPRGMNKGAFRGKLTCPVCESEAVRYVENVGPTRLRYRCRKCGLPFQYDISGGSVLNNHPYAPFKKPKWQKIVESSAYREK